MFKRRHNTDGGVFDDFPKISGGQTNVPEHFRKIFQNFSKIAENFRGRPEDVSITNQGI